MDKEPGYNKWLKGKVTKTLARMDDRTTVLHDHADAMALLKKRLEARLPRKPA